MTVAARPAPSETFPSVIVVRRPPARDTRRLLVPVVVAVLGVLALAGYIATYTHYLDLNLYPVVRSDGLGYFLYLPAWLVDHDPSLHHVVATQVQDHADWYGLSLQGSTGNYLDKYPVGEAIMLLPFFLIGHVIALLAGLNANGFSTPEEIATGLGGTFYMVAGLAVLGRALLRRFTPVITAATLVAVTFGSNLFHYGTFDSMFSHAFSFFLVACLIETTRYWYASPRTVLPGALLGANLGAILLVRNPNALFVVVPLLYGVWNRETLRERVEWLRSSWRHAVPVPLAALAVLAPQIGIWKIATGHWITYSYGSEGFEFGHPQILDTLFSFNPHGFLPWAPVMALALIGLVWMRRYAPELLVGTCVAFVATTYLIASWGADGPEWFYGAGYGDRAFVETFPLLAFGLASLFTRFSRGVAQRLVAVATGAGCLLVTVQMLHYWRLIVPFAGASFHDYAHLLPRRFW